MDYPFKDNTHPVSPDLSELILNRTWRPALSVIGIEGLPNLTQGGNVTIPNLSVKLSVRIPPGVDPGRAAQALTEALEKRSALFCQCFIRMYGPGSGMASATFGGMAKKCQ